MSTDPYSVLPTHPTTSIGLTWESLLGIPAAVATGGSGTVLPPPPVTGGGTSGGVETGGFVIPLGVLRPDPAFTAPTFPPRSARVRR